MPNTDEVLAALDRLEKEILPKIREEIRETRAWTRRRVLAFIGGLVVLVVLIVLVGLLALSNYHTGETAKQAATLAARQAACVQTYANQNAARADVLTPLANARADALDDWIKASPATFPKTAAELARAERISQAKRLQYLKASDAYSAAVQTHPLPLAPKFTC